MGRRAFNPDLLRWDDPPLIQATPSHAVYVMELSLPLPPCPLCHWQVYSFIDIGAHFFGILAYTEDKLRHPISQAEELLNFWTSIDRQPLLD